MDLWLIILIAATIAVVVVVCSLLQWLKRDFFSGRCPGTSPEQITFSEPTPPLADRAAARQRRLTQSNITARSSRRKYEPVSNAPNEPRVVQQIETVELSAKRKLASLQQAVQEQEALLESVRQQKHILKPFESPSRKEARALQKILRRLPSIAAGRTVDLSDVFGSQLHQRGQEAWGDAWNNGRGGQPPIKDVFRVSPGDMVDLRNYLRQLIRNADEGVSMNHSSRSPRTESRQRVKQSIGAQDGFMDFLHTESDREESKLHTGPAVIPALRLFRLAHSSRPQALPPMSSPLHAPQCYASHGATVPQLPQLPSSSGGSDSDSSIGYGDA